MLTVISLIVGIDYILHNLILSSSIVGLLAIIFAFAFFKIKKTDYDLFDLKILNHEVIVDLQDVNGDVALHTRKTKFESLKNKIATFTDHMSADGELEDAEVSPGTIEEIRKEGGDLFVKSNFGRVLKKGDIVEKTIKARLKNSFNNKPEYWSVRIILPTREFKLIIFFTETGHIQTFVAIKELLHTKKSAKFNQWKHSLKEDRL